MRDKYKNLFDSATDKNAVIVDDVLVEELIPVIRIQMEGETTPEYFNYVFDLINESLFVNPVKGRMIDLERSPVFKIWRMSANPNPMGLDDVSNMFRWIKQIELIKRSASQKDSFIHKVAFYFIWSLYDQGKSWEVIFDTVTTKLEVKGDRLDVLRNWRKYPKTFGWKRGAN